MCNVCACKCMHNIHCTGTDMILVTAYKQGKQSYFSSYGLKDNIMVIVRKVTRVVQHHS